jgi:hypothetical protein
MVELLSAKLLKETALIDDSKVFFQTNFSYKTGMLPLRTARRIERCDDPDYQHPSDAPPPVANHSPRVSLPNRRIEPPKNLSG